MPNSLRSRLKNLVYKGVLSQKDFDRIVTVPVDGNGDLISRQAAIRLAEQGQVQGFEWQFKQLVDLPSVSTEKTGRWIDDEFGSKCSCCGIHTHLDKFDRPMKFKHCSMCGTKMEVEESESCKGCQNICVMYDPNMKGCKDKMEGVEE